MGDCGGNRVVSVHAIAGESPIASVMRKRPFAATCVALARMNSRPDAGACRNPLPVRAEKLAHSPAWASTTVRGMAGGRPVFSCYRPLCIHACNFFVSRVAISGCLASTSCCIVRSLCKS